VDQITLIMGVDEAGNCTIDKSPEFTDEELVEIISKRFWNDYLDSYCLFAINFFESINAINEFPYNRPCIKRDIDKKIADHKRCRDEIKAKRVEIDEQCKFCKVNFEYTRLSAKKAALAMLRKEFIRHVDNDMVDLQLD
jgi:hypothetical protein